MNMIWQSEFDPAENDLIPTICLVNIRERKASLRTRLSDDFEFAEKSDQFMMESSHVIPLNYL